MGLFQRSFAIALFAGAASVASAGPMLEQNIVLTFSDPSAAQREIRYSQPAGPGQDGSLTYQTAVPIELEIQLEDVGINTPLLIDANLTMTIAVGQASPGSLPNQFISSVFGTFEFRRASDNEVLIIGEIGDGSLARRGSSGGVDANGLMASIQFDVTFTNAMVDELLGAGYAFPGFDTSREGTAAWTLTRILQTVPGGPTMVVGSDSFLSSFNADSAFTASLPVVPTPGAISLIAAAGVLVMGIRRRD